MKKLVLAMITLVMALGLTTTAAAGTATAIMDVTLTVSPHCTVSVGSINFGSHLSTDTTPADVTAAIDVVCDATIPYDIALDSGLHWDGASRNMNDGFAADISYELLDQATGNPWGDAGFGATNGHAPVSGLGTDSYFVDGSVTGWVQGAMSTGVYTDQVTVSVHY